jgi:5S rRNA maturation endonuclease (ribonuclease M5)
MTAVEDKDSQTRKMMILRIKMMRKIFEILEFFGIRNYYESNNLIVCSCPVHGGDNPSAFNINTDEYNQEYYGKWFCNTKHCHNSKPGKDIISLTWLLLENKHNRKLSFIEVLDFCNDFCSDVQIDENIQIRRKSPKDKLLKIETRKAQYKDRNITRSKVRKHLTFPAKFYIDRGFSEHALDLFDVGVCENPQSQMYKRVVFPVYDESDTFMVGCTGRTTTNHHNKWINQKGFNKSIFLYNYGKAISRIREISTMILVEGQGDVIRLWDAGIRNAVGIFGSKMSDAQEFLVQKTGAANIVIMTDNDDAGELCKRDINNRLKHLLNIHTISIPKNDIGEMTIQEIDTIIKPQIQGYF